MPLYPAPSHLCVRTRRVCVPHSPQLCLPCLTQVHMGLSQFSPQVGMGLGEFPVAESLGRGTVVGGCASE